MPAPENFGPKKSTALDQYPARKILRPKIYGPPRRAIEFGEALVVLEAIEKPACGLSSSGDCKAGEQGRHLKDGHDALDHRGGRDRDRGLPLSAGIGLDFKGWGCSGEVAGRKGEVKPQRLNQARAMLRSAATPRTTGS